MSEQKSVWSPGKSGADWRYCERYGLMISGCTRGFACSVCYDLFPNPKAIHTAKANGLKQMGFSLKQSVRSIKTVGV